MIAREKVIPANEAALLLG